MTVRPATGLDETAMVAAWADAQGARGLPPSKARQARVRAELRHPLALGLVATDGPRVVGMLLAEPWRDADGRPAAGVLHLAMLFVAPAAQRQGHGSALVAALLARYPSVRVRTREAVPFYEALGFRVTGRGDDAGVELESPALQALTP